MDKQYDNILFFDGICALCSGFIDFYLRRDKNGKLRFASLQGETAQKLLSKDLIEKKNTLVLIHEGELLTESTASLTAFKLMGGLYSSLYIFILVPKFIRNGVYKIIAKNRYAWFGIREECRVPKPTDKGRVLE